jgi:hypothetical protein
MTILPQLTRPVEAASDHAAIHATSISEVLGGSDDGPAWIRTRAQRIMSA